MNFIKERFLFLFCSTKGLILVAIAMISLVTVLFGTLSGPMDEMGVKDVAVRVFGLDLNPAEREGRIIILYHAIAIAVVAIDTYLITALYKVKKEAQARINGTITFGYLLSMIFGLWFAYFGHNYVFHGLFISGQVLIFFAGVQLLIVVNPWSREVRIDDPERAHTRSGVDMERVALFVMALATLISALFGAVPGSLFGNGFQSFLAEDIIRQPVKPALDRAIIGHLHIMLTLIAVALTLITSRWFEFKGKLQKWAMPLLIIGTIIISIGVWMVVPYQPAAHIIINVGSMPVLVASLLLVIYGWRRITRERLVQTGDEHPTFLKKLSALFHDPIKFGALWQMIYMNFVVTFVGIFMAVKLDDIIRTWSHREERIALTGHWHVLSGIIATIILLYYADLAGLKGRARKWFGWIVILGSDLAFGAIAVLETKRLYVSELNQQPLVDTVVLLGDIGLFSVLILLGVLMFWRLGDLFTRSGRWKKELQQPDLDTKPEVQS